MCQWNALNRYVEAGYLLVDNNLDERMVDRTKELSIRRQRTSWSKRWQLLLFGQQCQDQVR